MPWGFNGTCYGLPVAIDRILIDGRFQRAYARGIDGRVWQLVGWWPRIFWLREVTDRNDPYWRRVEGLAPTAS